MPGSAPLRDAGSPDARPDDRVAIVTGLRRIVKALETYSRAVQREFGLTGPQLWAVKVLARGQLTAGELAQALAVHQSSVSVLVERLERRGLVRRTRDPDDRRVVHVALTARGAALGARAGAGAGAPDARAPYDGCRRAD